MQEVSGVDARQDGADERSVVLEMMSSDDWQSRLEAARLAREKALAGKPPAPRPPLQLIFDKETDPAPAPALEDLVDSLEFEIPAGAEVPGTGAVGIEQYLRAQSTAAPVFRRPPGGDREEGFLAEAAAKAQVRTLSRAARTFPELTSIETGPDKAQDRRNAGRIGLRAVVGFAIGLVAGVAATSIIWLSRPDLPSPTETAVATLDTTAAQPVNAAVETAAMPAPTEAPVAPLTPAAQPVVPTPSAPAAADALPGAVRLPNPDAPVPGVVTLAQNVSAPVRGVAPRPAAVGSSGTPPATVDAALRRPLAQTVMTPGATPKFDSEPKVSAAAARPLRGSAALIPGPSVPDRAPRAVDAPPAVALAPEVSRLPQPDPRRSATAGASNLTVKVLAPARVPDAEVQVAAERVRSAGYAIDDPARVAVTVSATHVRYYNVSDRAAAEQLATSFGGEARDFTDASSPAPPGTVELWLEGSSPAAAKPRTAKAKATGSRRPVATENPEMKALRQRILRNLQGG